jgi:elongation factor Ts
MSASRPIGAELVKQLREETGAGMMDCKRALEETGGDLDKARDHLRTKGLAGVEKRAGRTASEGVIDAYVHGEGRLGVLVEVNCETDFVARTDEFRQVAREIAMQIAASGPQWISRDEVPADVIAGERKIYEEQASTGGKPENIIERIVDGKVEAFFKQYVLLDQPYIRDDSKTVQELVNEIGVKVGEKVAVRRFARYRLGEDG